MINYIIWRNDDDSIMVEVLNECDILSVQKELLDKGYIVIRICRGVFDDKTFMQVEKVEE